MAAIYTKKTNRLNINASVFDEIKYRLSRYGNFTAYEIADGINLTRQPSDPDEVTLRQVRSRISGHIGGHFDLVKNPHTAYYSRRVK